MAKTNKCRYDPCTCTSDEKWSCLTEQWNKFDRPAEEEEEKKTTVEFKEAVKNGDLKKAQRLLPNVKFQW